MQQYNGIQTQIRSTDTVCMMELDYDEIKNILQVARVKTQDFMFELSFNSHVSK